ncbi:MAG TPA: sugar transferase, partial [Candidatus Dorea faecipullorum]|nr:sugar transferase [Candidatus Dorea faecipullorum]
MRRGKKLLSTAVFALTSGTVIYNLFKKCRKTKEEQSIDSQVKNQSHKPGFYERYIKRPQDFLCALAAVVVLLPVMAVTAFLVRLKLGSPVIFKQERPGLNGKVFILYKFRTMTDEKDTAGNLLPDEVRLTKFGKMLRSTSLDELPE